MSDDSPTIFNPFGAGQVPAAEGGAKTVLIPNPGRRQSPLASGAGAPHGSPQPTPIQSAPLPTNLRPESASNNPFLASATPLIAVLCALRHTVQQPDAVKLQTELAAEIRTLESKLQRDGVRSEEIQIARYILCSALDETIMNTPWGTHSGWSQRSLLRIYHNETSGGERFFTLLEQAMNRSSEFWNLLELFYALLALGFEGRYHHRLNPHGPHQLETLRERLYSLLYASQPPPSELSPNWRSSVAKHGRRLMNIVPIWVVAAATLCLVLLVYSGLRVWMYTGTVAVKDRFEQVHAEKNQSY